MHCKSLLVSAALAGLATSSALLPRVVNEIAKGQVAVSTINDNDGGSAKDAYTYFTGNGSHAAGWPAQSQWASFNNLWNINLPALQQSCGWNSWGADNSATEIANVRTAIETVAAASKVDHRFILAVIMQESAGCVRVPTTGNGVTNPGMMQSHDGPGTCANTTPCPQSEIRQMIADGTRGTASGAGLALLLNQAQTHLGDGDIGQIFYSAARLYNSGSINWNNLDDGITSTPCYASDVANRLTGWILAPSKCTAT